MAPTLNRWQPPAPPSRAKTQIPQRDTTLPTAPRPTKITLAPLTRPASLSENQPAPHSLASNPHRLTPPPAQNTPRFPSSRLFGRLPPCLPPRLRLAGIRKPLTITAVRNATIEPPARLGPRAPAGTQNISEAVAHVFRDEAAEPPDLLGKGGVIGADHLAQILGVEAGGQRFRADYETGVALVVTTSAVAPYCESIPPRARPRSRVRSR